LREIRYGGAPIRDLLAPGLVDLAERWPKEVADENRSQALLGLSHILTVLSETEGEVDRSVLTALCLRNVEAAPEGPFATAWLIRLFRFDFSSGVDVLMNAFQNPCNGGHKEAVLRFLAAGFGDRSEAVLPDETAPNRAFDLARLLHFAYHFVRREEDRVHDGAFSPDTRDEAETARGFLLNALVSTPGPEARNIILELAQDPLFRPFADRLRMVSFEQVAKDSEFEPYDGAQIRELEYRFELAPRTGRELLDVLMGRLSDLEHDLHHHKFSLLPEWQSIKKELDAQRLLANRLHEKRGHAYTAVTREEQVADENSTDVTLTTVLGTQEQVTAEGNCSGGWPEAGVQGAGH